MRTPSRMARANRKAPMLNPRIGPPLKERRAGARQSRKRAELRLP
jgi:hypothetical protein